jgi:hypothetical protein
MNKDFDCVEMKNRIQQEIAKEMEGLTLEERQAKTLAAIMANPVLARVWKNARRVSSTMTQD